MAYWRRIPGTTRVQVWDSRGNYVRKRGVYDHLDNEPDHNVDSWVRAWELRTGDGWKQPAPPPMDSYWERLVSEYAEDRRKRLKRSKKTISGHTKALTERVIPYFVQHCQSPDPNTWPRVSAGFLKWAEEHKATPDNILVANSALNGFWEFLRLRQKVLQGMGIALLTPLQEERLTPLPRLIEPDEILSYLKIASRIDVPKSRKNFDVERLRREIQLMALLGYFFSLRPQETFALRRCDFVAGSGAAEVLACRVMSSHALLLNEKQKLFGKLTVEIHRQREQDGKFSTPKAYSRGWVSCFDERGARAIVELLKKWEDKEELLFRHKPDRQFKWWALYGIGAAKAEDSGKPLTADPKPKPIPKISLKDLRRSSLLWLGHFTSMDLVALRGHSRHKKEDMVLRYLRRPGERPDRGDDLDLDA